MLNHTLTELSLSVPDADQQQDWLAQREEECQRWQQHQQEQQRLTIEQTLETRIENERRHLQECIDQLSALSQQRQQAETLLQQQIQQRQALLVKISLPKSASDYAYSSNRQSLPSKTQKKPYNRLNPN